MKLRIGNPKDFLAGLLFSGFAALLIYNALLLPLGTARSMGPGYFPLVLAVILGVLGVITTLKGLRPEGDRVARVTWRGVFFVIGSVVLFGLTVHPFGFIPAVALSVAVATLGSAEARPLPALGLVAFLVVFCWLVFIKGLGMPVPLFG
jgi:putative tricarboxylic transport membrane protein